MLRRVVDVMEGLFTFHFLSGIGLADRLTYSSPLSRVDVCPLGQALSKEIWRAGFLDCPSSCSPDTAWEDCQCECDAGKIGSRTPLQVRASSKGFVFSHCFVRYR